MLNFRRAVGFYRMVVEHEFIMKMAAKETKKILVARVYDMAPPAKKKRKVGNAKESSKEVAILWKKASAPSLLLLLFKF